MRHLSNHKGIEPFSDTAGNLPDADAGEERLPALRARRQARRAGRNRLPIERQVRPHRHRRHVELRSVVWSVRTLALEVMDLVAALPEQERNRRHAAAHIRQISIYLCHVALQIPMAALACGFCKDFTTISHACARVEDRRDDPAYDRLLTALERSLLAFYRPLPRGCL